MKDLEGKALKRAMGNADDSRFRDRKCDWNNKTDVAEYRRQKKQQKRNDELHCLVPDRVCPNCNRIYLQSSSWVVKDGIALCRGCHRSRNARSFVIDFVEERRYTMLHRKLTVARGELSLDQAAKLCGWTRPRQSQLEGGNIDTVNEKTMIILRTIFALELPQLIRFKAKGSDLTKAREGKGLSGPALAERCGWSSSYQYQLEGCEVFTINQTSRKKLGRILDTVTKG